MGVVYESKKLYENQVTEWIRRVLSPKDYTISPKAAQMLVEFLGTDLSKINNELENKSCDEEVMKIFIKSCIGLSHGLIKKEINKILKDMIINNKEIEQVLCENISTREKNINREDKLSLAYILFTKKLMTQRKLSESLCISRDAIRKFNIKN